MKHRHHRVSHITFAQALARMVSGPFAASDIAAVTGLHRTTVYKLTRSLEKAGAVHMRGKRPDTLGRLSVEEFELGPKKNLR